MTLNMPSVAVSVDFTHDPMSGSFTWTDLTKRSWNFTVTRGRTYELTQVQAGTGKVTMENIDGAIDPTNTASPYSPNVMVFRRLKIEATWNGVLHAVYAGLVERWPMEWQDNLTVSPVECTDVFAILANKDLQAAVLAEALTDAPAALYPLNDPAGSLSAADATGQNAPAPVQVGPYGAGTLTFGAASQIIGQSSMMALTSPDAGQVSGRIPVTGTNPVRATWLNVPNSLAGLTAGTVEIWFVAPTSPPSAADELVYCLAPADQTLAKPGTSVQTGTGYLNVVGFPTVSINVCDGLIHCVQFDYTTAVGTAHLYLDGVLVQTAATSTTYSNAYFAPGTWTLGVQTYTFSGLVTVGFPFSGSLALFGQYPSILSSGRLLAHYNAGFNAFAGETADARITRLLSYAGWTGTSAIDACSTTVLAADSIAGQKALTAIQAVATTEGGAFFVGRDGTPTYQSRRTRMANVTPVAIFGDGPGELPYESLSFDFDPTYVYNDIEITRSTASGASATDVTSTGHYGPRSLPVQMDISTDTELATAAAWLLASYKDPHVRVSGITLHPSAVSDPAMWTACLSLEIGSRVTVKRRPKGTTNPNPISGDYFVEQVSITSWTADDATFRLALSPIPIQALIADDPTFGICDSIYVAAW